MIVDHKGGGGDFLFLGKGKLGLNVQAHLQTCELIINL